MDTSIIMNGSSDNNKENQLLVNSLEDIENPIRVVFSVDMLNEGWDVLNLFDIVRLYDTRQASGKAGKIGAYTIKEAQLIGRGARYCPFVDGDDELKFKRKYDFDLENKNRILETMYFHSKNDSVLRPASCTQKHPESFPFRLPKARRLCNDIFPAAFRRACPPHCR